LAVVPPFEVEEFVVVVFDVEEDVFVAFEDEPPPQEEDEEDLSFSDDKSPLPVPPELREDVKDDKRLLVEGGSAPMALHVWASNAKGDFFASNWKKKKREKSVRSFQELK